MRGRKTGTLLSNLGALATVREATFHRPFGRRSDQVAAISSFTRYEFEAAATTAFGIATSAHRVPSQRGIKRTAVLRFDHPYAALAITGRPVLDQPEGINPNRPSLWNGLPLFSAWIDKPQAADEPPPQTSA